MKRALVSSLTLILAASLTSGAAQTTATERSQERISHEVRNELVTLPQLSIFDDLAYKVDGDTVTLTGQVRNPILKDSAGKVVKNIEGVKEVNNNIEVLPPSRNDDRIRHEVARAIFNDARLSRYSMGAVQPIHIIVNRGHVTLVGVVANQADKDAAGLRANGVPGVFSVQNDLRVENAAAAEK